LQAQFAQAQSALVKMLAQRLKERPVFGKGAQNALRFDHGKAGWLANKSRNCTAYPHQVFTLGRSTAAQRVEGL
jgi:hypothetical protein